jgi:ATPase subunit of ABC transporter with duplicated ATPase domains
VQIRQGVGSRRNEFGAMRYWRADPVVIIGTNGGGKTRFARQISTGGGAPLEFVNALQNTRVSLSCQQWAKTQRRLLRPAKSIDQQ